MNIELENYIHSHIDSEGDYLYRLYRATNLHTIHGRMISGHTQGRLLKMLVEMAQPKNVLEVGTFSGYSALCMAEGLGEDGKLYTFEINDEMEDFTRPWIEGSAVADKIDFRIGDANVEAPKLGIVFDMAFLDGDKRTYVETYETVLSILRPGGFILADNTLWDGHIVDSAYDRDHQTRGIRKFNDFIANDDRVEKVILPIRDGLTIIRKK
ncbi:MULTISPECIES: O-methyltransferase [Prevotella]|uniref:O-methyltransferase n=1 Tax=Prevotella TaxID=838 RepID=UPI0010309821|nr:O-methyltransferase [Prevotella brunnea]MDR0186429.1 methyltransferase [Prevotella brunnea]